MDSIKELEQIEELEVEKFGEGEMDFSQFDESKCEMLIRASLACTYQLKKLQEHTESEIQKLQEKSKIIEERYQKKIDNMNNFLELYMMKEMQSSKGKIKSKNFLSGMIGLRKMPDNIQIDIPEEDYKTKLKDFTTEETILKIKLDKAALKKYVKDAPVLGVTLIEGETKFYVKEN